MEDFLQELSYQSSLTSILEANNDNSRINLSIEQSKSALTDLL